jgi:hypothetical protein
MYGRLTLDNVLNASELVDMQAHGTPGGNAEYRARIFMIGQFTRPSTDVHH